MVFNVTITIGAIISAQPLGSIILRWFSDKNYRQRCFPMVVNNRSSDAIITMHRSSLMRIKDNENDEIEDIGAIIVFMKLLDTCC